MTNRDFDILLPFLLEFAQRMLVAQGHFFPFAGGVTSTGEVTGVSGDTGQPHPAASEVVAMLFDGLQSQASSQQIVAAGMCMNVRVQPPGMDAEIQAVCVELQHCEGDAIDVFLPYVVTAAGTVEFGPIFSSPGEQTLFLPTAG